MAAPAAWDIIHGDGANMALVGTGEAQLVVTSPPYFSNETEPLLRAPRKAQTEHERVQREVVAYALTLRPVLHEIGRILAPSGTLVVQTKDIRYGGFLIGLAATHGELAESAGLRLRSRVYWHSPFEAPYNTPRASSASARQVGGYAAPDVEEFLVFQRPGHQIRAKRPTQVTEEERDAWAEPLWRTPGPGRGEHPYRSPREVIRRFVLLYSGPVDLVVDPFSGSGTTVRVAAENGRRAIGYEIEEKWATESAAKLRQAFDREAP
jgi:modification methylase